MSSCAGCILNLRSLEVTSNKSAQVFFLNLCSKARLKFR